MDAGSINEGLLKNLQQLRQTQVSVLSQLLGLKTGAEFSASVLKISDVSASERAQLQADTKTALAQTQQNSNAPAAKALIQQLNAQLHLQQNPALKLIELQLAVPTTTGSNSLLTYTDKPLILGQNLLLRIEPGQKLLLLAPLTRTGQGTQTTGLNAGTAPALDTLLSPNQQLLRQALNSKTLDALGSTLRALLPLQDKPPSLLQALPKLLQTLQSLPPAARQQWLSERTQTALTQVDKQLPSPLQLANPHTVIQRLKDSGINFEHKLAQLFQTSSTGGVPSSGVPTAATTAPEQSPPAVLINKPQGSAHAITPNLAARVTAKATGELVSSAQLAPESNGLNPLKQPQASPAAAIITATSVAQATAPSTPIAVTTLNAKNQALAGTAKMDKPLLMGGDAPKPAQPNPGRSLEQLAARDLKGALLGLNSSLERELKTLSASIGGAQALLAANKPIQQPNLMQLIGQMANRQLPELSQKVLRAQLVMLLQQQTFVSLAKVQLQQLHSLNHQQAQLDAPLPSQSWQVDIPLRHGQELHQVNMHWEQRWVDVAEQDDQGARKTSKQRQWNVMLKFELPVVGQFYAQLQLLGNQLSARLWAEQERTLAEAKRKTAELQAQLEQQGVTVTQIQCLPGLPSQPKMTLSYSLVDIKT